MFIVDSRYVNYMDLTPLPPARLGPERSAIPRRDEQHDECHQSDQLQPILKGIKLNASRQSSPRY